MAGLPSWTLPRRQNAHPWPRRRFRRWARSSDPATIGALLAAIPSFPRAELARLTERLIDRMDELDGDLDLGPNGDELDGTFGEDDFVQHSYGCGWGFPGDPEDAEDDDEDCCPAGDDDVRSGLSPSHQYLQYPIGRIGDDVDAEPECPPVMDHLEQEKARA